MAASTNVESDTDAGRSAPDIGLCARTYTLAAKMLLPIINLDDAASIRVHLQSHIWLGELTS
jgi:hypothetical protein